MPIIHISEFRNPLVKICKSFRYFGRADFRAFLFLSFEFNITFDFIHMFLS